MKTKPKRGKWCAYPTGYGWFWVGYRLGDCRVECHGRRLAEKLVRALNADDAARSKKGKKVKK